jgi:RHS repeat-associated protein
VGSWGQMTSVTDANNKTTNFGYDSYGNQTTVTNPLGKVWTTTFDLAGRKTKVTDPLNHETEFAYNPNDDLVSVTDARGKVTSFGYDNAGNRTSTTDPNNKVTGFGYDAKNRLETVTDAEGGVTTYTYDANDNLTSVKDANNHTRSYTYDFNNLQLTEKDALNNTTTFVYDGAGNRTKRTDAKGQATTYAYDAINRLTTVTYPSGMGSVTYGYNTSDAVTSMTDSTGTTTYTLDELYRPSSITMPGNKVLGYLYDPAGNRSRITYPDSKQVNYTYDDANRMDTVTDWASGVTDYDYDFAGRLTTTTLPNGVVQTSSYNNADQLTGIEAVKGGTTLTDFGYTLDNAGMRTAVQTPAGLESYTYDDLYRLTGVTYPDSSTQAYTYDNVGNRQTKVEGSTTSYTYDNADRMTTAGGVTYTYDNNGNQTGRGSDVFGWDIEDRLVSATVGGNAVSYAYRGDDLRHSKTQAGVTTVYTWDLAAELPVVLQEGNTSYVYGLGLISQTTGTTASYPLADGLGSTAALTDSSGAVTATYKYDVFGAVKSSTGPGSTEFRFAGQQDDLALGYQYLRARYYDPATGRFISKDPLENLTRTPYTYASNNASNFVDPTGLFTVGLCGHGPSIVALVYATGGSCFQLAISKDRFQIGTSHNGNVGAGTPAVNLFGFGIQASNGALVSDLSGRSAIGGGSGGQGLTAGLDGFVGKNSDGCQIVGGELSFGVLSFRSPIPFEAHAGVGVTTTKTLVDIDLVRIRRLLNDRQ